MDMIPRDKIPIIRSLDSIMKTTHLFTGLTFALVAFSASSQPIAKTFKPYPINNGYNFYLYGDGCNQPNLSQNYPYRAESRNPSNGNSLVNTGCYATDETHVFFMSKNGNTVIDAATIPLTAFEKIPNQQANGVMNQFANACYSSLESEPTLASIKNKIPLSGGRPSLEMLSNDAKPSKNEKKAIADWELGLSKCNEQIKNGRTANLSIQENQLLQNSFLSLRSLIADLYAGKLSYGQFLKAKQITDASTATQMAEISAQNQRDRNRQAQLERQNQLQEQALQEQKRTTDAINGVTQNQQNQESINRGLYILKNGL